MKERKALGNVLFWLTLISPIASFAIAGMIGEANIFEVAGIVRYSWVMLLFIPIGVFSILIGSKLKSSNQSYKKNFIVSFICLPLLIIFGSYRLIFNNVVSYDAGKVSEIAVKINLELPDDVKVATVKLDLYDMSCVKIMDDESTEAFEREIGSNKLWKNELNSEIKGLLPLDILYESVNYDYFVFYNITSNEYNIPPKDGEFEYIFVAYDREMQKLKILEFR